MGFNHERRRANRLEKWRLSRRTLAEIVTTDPLWQAIQAERTRLYNAGARRFKLTLGLAAFQHVRTMFHGSRNAPDRYATEINDMLLRRRQIEGWILEPIDP